MTPAQDSAHKPWLALFDLDGTLTWRDTLLPFLSGFVRRHPQRWAKLWRIPFALGAYLHHKDRGQLKAAMIRICMGGELRGVIEAWTQAYVAAMKPKGRFRATALAVLQAHRDAGDTIILLSASPDLYVPTIGSHLGFERTLCTELRWNGERLDGELNTPNRRGAEKSRCLQSLRAQYPGLSVIAYGNSDSDLAHMREADRALLVNGDAHARRLAIEANIPVSNWT